LDNDLLQSLNLSAPGNESLIIPLLSVDGEDVYSLTQLPELLLLARHLLESLRKTLENTDDLCDFNLWQSRALFTQQQLLDNPSDTLYAQLTRALEMHEFKLSCDATGESRRTHMAEYHLFHGLVENYYQQNSRAKRHFELAQSATGLQWEMTGALGRRTKFQDFDVAQLTLNAKSNCSEDPVVNASSAAIPKSLALNDDTLLEQIEFNNASATAYGVSDSNGRLAVIDQCILLGFCLNVRNTNPAHGLTSEQMMPFVTRVIEQPSNWLVHTMALLLRSRLESTRSRTVERSVFQLQALVDQFSLTDQAEGGAGVDERMQYYWLLALPSRWSMERELGERWMGVGMAKSAREIFERLQMWDQVIACYQISDEDEKVRCCCFPIYILILYNNNAGRENCPQRIGKVRMEEP
jgi:hypothetical protein